LSCSTQEVAGAAEAEALAFRAYGRTDGVSDENPNWVPLAVPSTNLRVSFLWTSAVFGGFLTHLECAGVEGLGILGTPGIGLQQVLLHMLLEHPDVESHAAAQTD
jgi:hypothetical protein